MESLAKCLATLKTETLPPVSLRRRLRAHEALSSNIKFPASRRMFPISNLK
jgi:hypothetical protein